MLRVHKKSLILLLTPLLVLFAASGTYAAIKLATGGGVVNLNSGLVGWWKMDGDASDSSPYGYNGTVIGGVLAADRFGSAESAYSFDGVSHHITTASHGFTGTSPGSVSVWFKTSQAANVTNPLVAWGSTAQGQRILLSVENGAIWERSSLGVVTSGGSGYNDNQWHHLVFIKPENADLYGLQLYVDGEKIVHGGIDVNRVLNISTSKPVDIGGDAVQNSYYFNGTIDDLRIYKRTLSTAEVLALYSQSSLPKTSLKTDSGENGLVGWWKLDGNAKDATPHANNGRLRGAVPPVLAPGRTGTPNTAYSFNGNDYIVIPATPSLDVSSTFTLEGWVKLNSYGAAGSTIIAKRAFSTSDEQWALRIFAANSLQLNWHSANGYWQANSAVGLGSAITLGSWHHIAVTATGSSIAYYVDGAKYSSTGTPPSFQSYPDSPVCIGQDCNNSVGRFVDGVIDDVRIYNRALPSSEIASQYNSGGSQISLYKPSGGSGSDVNLTAGLVGWWPFNGNAKDNTPQQHNGSLSTNPPTLTADRKGRANSAYAFDGAFSQFISVSDNSSLRFGTSNFTVSTWVKFPVGGSFGAWEGIIGKGWGTTAYPNTWGLVRVSNTTNRGTYQDVGDVGGVFNAALYSPTLTDGWHHFVLTRSASIYSLYIDGSPSQTVNKPVANLNTNAPLWIGQAAGRYLTGSIDDVRIYNRALSAAEVQALYNVYY